jgi:hypothetical protein
VGVKHCPLPASPCSALRALRVGPGGLRECLMLRRWRSGRPLGGGLVCHALWHIQPARSTSVFSSLAIFARSLATSGSVRSLASSALGRRFSGQAAHSARVFISGGPKIPAGVSRRCGRRVHWALLSLGCHFSGCGDAGRRTMSKDAWALGEYPLPMVRISCAKCDRAGRYFRAKPLERHGVARAIGSQGDQEAP